MISYNLKNEMVKMFYEIKTPTDGMGTCFICNKANRTKIGIIDYIILNGVKIETYDPNIYIYNDGIVTFAPLNKQFKGVIHLDFNNAVGICKDVILNISVEKIKISNRYTYALVIDVKE